jgi:spore coat polysaccharide biosynthesis protein SpsF
MNRVAIIQARMGSKRLPGKVLMNLVDRAVLEWVVCRVRQSTQLDAVTVATTIDSRDDILAERCREWNVPCYRGSEDDVLARFYAAASEIGADLVLRVNADNPLLDPVAMDRLVKETLASKTEYSSYRLRNGSPVMLTGLGLFTEALTFECLELAHRTLTEPAEREHVTLGIYRRPLTEKLLFLAVPAFCDDARIRLTLDCLEDFRMLERICLELGRNASSAGAEDVVALLSKHPAWLDEMASRNAMHDKKRV